MASTDADADPVDIILYDLACTKNVCFSPVVWRIRMLLNYKGIKYRTVFLEFPDIEPTLKELGVTPPATANGRYTVPTIHHIPTQTYMMDSVPISQFLNTTYPHPPLPLTSPLGTEIEIAARAAVGPAFRASMMPREILILSPRSQDHFRRRTEASLGHRLEELLEVAGREDEAWRAADQRIREAGEKMLNGEGMFVLGARPSYTDFSVAGSLQCARVIDEGVFERICKYPGYGRVYEGCAPYMEKKD